VAVLREKYLKDMKKAQEQGPHRGTLSCGNLAHGFAACQPQDKTKTNPDGRGEHWYCVVV